jgi:GNAT superfamily N-acetyltransferase
MRQDRAAAMIVRRIAPADAMLLRDVRLRALQGEPLAFGSTYSDEAARDLTNWETWASNHASGADKATFLALRDGAPLGLASGMRSDVATHFGLFSMWVDLAERRGGVGRQLVEAVAAWIVASGGTRLTLWVTQSGAQSFYGRLGFVDDGRRKPLPHTPEVIEVGMTREL